MVLHQTPGIQQDIYFTSSVNKTTDNNTEYSNILKPSHSSHLSAYEDGTECSETSAYKIQTPGNYQEESMQNTGHHWWQSLRVQ